MQPPFRSKQEVIINAPLEVVWSFSMDLTKIPEFHPRVVKVDLLSGKTLREPGASYQCHLSGGKHTCIEKDIEITEDRHCVAGGQHSVSARFSAITEWKRRSKRSAIGQPRWKLATITRRQP